MNPMLLGGIISGAGGLLSSLFSGKSKARESTVPTPGPWEPDSKRIWDAAMQEIFGAEGYPPLAETIAQDVGYQRAGYEDYLRRSADSTQGYIDQLTNAARTYLNRPVSGSIGGQTISFIPKM